MKSFYLTIMVAASATLLPLTAIAAEPLPPSNVSAVSTAEGVVITWQAVNEDIDENYVDPEEVIYDVFRCDVNDNRLKVGEDIDGTTYTDVLGEITGEVYYRWQVIAKTADGSSSIYEGYSPQLSFGDGSPLPYKETFNTPGDWSPEPDNFWLAEHTSGWADFDVETYLYFNLNGNGIYIYGADHNDETDDGFLYFEPSKWTESDVTFTSGNINLASATNPVLSIMFYTFPEAHNSYQINIVDNEGTVHEMANTIPTGTELGWEKTEINLTEFKGEKIKIRLHAAYNPDNAPQSGVRVPICFDNIMIDDKTSSGIDDIVSDNITETVYFSIDGRIVENPAAGQFVIKIERSTDGTVKTSKFIMR